MQDHTHVLKEVIHFIWLESQKPVHSGSTDKVSFKTKETDRETLN